MPSEGNPYSGNPESALTSLVPQSGAIRAMVGGPDFLKHKLNLAVQSRRQAGSAFKAFTLAAALEQGIPIGKVYKTPNPVHIPPGPDDPSRSDRSCSADGSGVPGRAIRGSGRGTGATRSFAGGTGGVSARGTLATRGAGAGISLIAGRSTSGAPGGGPAGAGGIAPAASGVGAACFERSAGFPLGAGAARLASSTSSGSPRF